MSNRARRRLSGHHHALRREFTGAVWWVCTDPLCPVYGDHFDAKEHPRSAVPEGSTSALTDESPGSGVPGLSAINPNGSRKDHDGAHGTR